MPTLCDILSSEGLDVTASGEPDFRDLEIVLKGLGKITFLKYTPGSGSVQVTLTPHVGGGEVMISGKYDGSVLTFDAAITRKIKGYKIDIPYEDHNDTVAELRKYLGL